MFDHLLELNKHESLFGPVLSSSRIYLETDMMCRSTNGISCSNVFIKEPFVICSQRL